MMKISILLLLFSFSVYANPVAEVIAPVVEAANEVIEEAKKELPETEVKVEKVEKEK